MLFESDLDDLLAEEEPDRVVTDIYRLYQLAKEPPEMPLNNYIIQYKQTGNEKYFQYFLHCYEHILNKMVENFCDKHKLICRFEDVKQTIVTTIIERISHYDLSVGTTLLQYVEQYIKGALNRYLRLYSSTAYSMSADEYKLFVKVNAIYYDNKHLPNNEVWAEISRQTDLKNEVAMQIVVDGHNFRYPHSMDFRINDEHEKGITIEDKVPDIYSNTEENAIRNIVYDDLVEAVETLPDKTKTIFLADRGILCLHCGKINKHKIPQQDIANMFELYSTRAVQKQVDKAVETIIKEMTTKCWLRVMNIKQDSKIVKKGEVISVTYSYRPMFSTDEGLIEFDLTQLAERKYIIDRFTSQDREYPFFRQIVQEVAKMQKSGIFYKEKLIVWWKD